jgi:hypothetical protein
MTGPRQLKSDQLLAHLASYAVISRTGEQIGTHYVYKLSDVAAARKKPQFKWRNDECRLRWIKYAIGA